MLISAQCGRDLPHVRDLGVLCPPTSATRTQSAAALVPPTSAPMGRTSTPRAQQNAKPREPRVLCLCSKCVKQNPAGILRSRSSRNDHYRAEAALRRFYSPGYEAEPATHAMLDLHELCEGAPMQQARTSDDLEIIYKGQSRAPSPGSAAATEDVRMGTPAPLLVDPQQVRER
jgi:hypothetical protein